MVADASSTSEMDRKGGPLKGIVDRSSRRSRLLFSFAPTGQASPLALLAATRSPFAGDASPESIDFDASIPLPLPVQIIWNYARRPEDLL